MKCARLKLMERSKPLKKLEKNVKVEKPRRYCQKRLVNPEHEEDPRWIDVFERFHCNEENDQLNETLDSNQAPHDNEDMFLTVQTLQFHGEVEQRKRPRTSFKYKNVNHSDKHRMFIKQVITDQELTDEEKSSELTCYYFDDYIKYLFQNDKSRPASGMSSIFLQGLSNKLSDNKANEVSTLKCRDNKNSKKSESKTKKNFKKINKNPDDINDDLDSDIEDTKITYKNMGKRKSLTISRTQSPETVQVIRVDVVCNYSNVSTNNNTEETKEPEILTKVQEKINASFDTKTNHFASKYQLTKTIKTLDENLSGGSKVTLLCKTFKLSDRSKIYVNCKNYNPRYPKTNGSKNLN